MSKLLTVTATEANRSFSKLLREVERGNRVTVTSHGRHVAVIVPVDDDATVRERRAKALEALHRRRLTQKHITVGSWTREELYERN